MIISPPGIAPVCRGDQLELTCTVTGSFLEWSFSLIPEGETTARRYARVLHTTSIPATSQLVVNSITFTFSRTSAVNSLQLTSMLLIKSVNDGLNGTEVNCADVETSETVSTFVNILNEDQIIGRLQKVINHAHSTLILKLCLWLAITIIVYDCFGLITMPWLVCL